MCIRFNRIIYILSISILFLNSCATQQTGDIENGYGKITFSTGASYEGNFKDGEYHGIGTWYNSTNSLYGQGGYYTGEWYEGLMHGKGLQRLPNGNVLEGIFKNHRFISGIEYTAAEYQQKIDKQETIVKEKQRRKAKKREKELIKQETIVKENQRREAEKREIELIKQKEQISFNNAKAECEAIGFKKGTEKFGQCVLDLTE